MKKVLLLSIITLLVGVSSDTLAQGRNQGKRMNDRARIQRGIRSGQITRDEARELRDRQRQIRADRREIRRDDRDRDREIRRARRNDDRRPSYGRDDDRRRGNGYYRRGRGSRSHPVFGDGSRRRNR